MEGMIVISEFADVKKLIIQEIEKTNKLLS